MSQPRSLKEKLIANDETFRSLYEEHLDCKRQLEEIRRRSLPSQEDEIEVKRIKVRKLHLKDQMEMVLQSHTEQQRISA